MFFDASTPCIAEHPLDVLKKALAFQHADQGIALAILEQTRGGAVRSRGAMMVINELGDSVGYLSGGCIDQDIVTRAIDAIKSDELTRLKYGAGSPFIDIQLPCGGALDIALIPNPDSGLIDAMVDRLESRRKIYFQVSNSIEILPDVDVPPAGSFCIQPKLQLRIAGKGREPIALAKAANSAGIDVSLWTPDEHCLRMAVEYTNAHVLKMDVPDNLPHSADDPQTAFVLMFHDRDWEVDLLQDALEGHAFYIGAVGSRKTHAQRCESLLKRGVSANDVNRIHAPIGLVSSTRDASTLAISTLAEILSKFQTELAE